ncbi:nitrate reductase molybdenum cofactor assembly chaperone [Mycolicibacter sinensis]|uniref:Nitrate reductase molybdenum cofactor assembly chaperone n=1 Tax=Mycolicibacter sinensis (strain JDM601) TaxID=875328 RepID=A0A1A2XZU6_MYCSD|nr:nitrate reductase molybdenum cofactor assembly chaperone [Mycolicibacter sinensis]OBH17247.1 nitrate reductase molybdenum cofactor assembly chaperone [Mycolicibacter sinensis]OBI31275.1 nitrate reductase molybdenum cofactor assembly chaperone [Mycolicibacter sinensis]
MKRFFRSRRRPPAGPGDRAVWQAASLLLAYPDEQLQQRLDTVEALLAHADAAPAELLRRTVSALRAADPMTAAADYVETFDMRRRSTMFLTYWTGGDTRNRGMQMLAFATAYRDAGAEPPAGEAPDHLPVVLEFAATVDPEAGRRLLLAHRTPIDVLHKSLSDAESPYAYTLAAVCETLPAATDQEVRNVRELMASGPPAEAVGLQPYSATVSLGMPKVPTR